MRQHRYALLTLLLSFAMLTPRPQILKKELATFIENEQAQARVHQSIHSLTSMCWDKCVL